MSKHRLEHAELAAALRPLRLGVDPSDLHGSLSGYLCGGGRPGEDDWLAALELDPADGASAGSDLLRRFYRECRAQFEAEPAHVEPLLPEPAALARRAAALVEWCRGFLGGFGLSGAAQRRLLSQDAKEILADFGTIAGSQFETSERREDEEALADVLDFARTAVAVLHREMLRSAPAQRLH